MELPVRALRSKDFPQDRQTKLQNTLTPASFPYHPHPRFITVQETPHCSRLWLTQLVFSLSLFHPFFLTFFHLFTFSLFCHFWTSLQLTLVDSGSFLTQFFTSPDPQVHLVSLSVLDLDITSVDSG